MTRNCNQLPRGEERTYVPAGGVRRLFASRRVAEWRKVQVREWEVDVGADLVLSAVREPECPVDVDLRSSSSSSSSVRRSCISER
jgi:hypothetical protein